MKNEVSRRLDILNKKKVPMVTARMLRGGMQERLHRQEVLKYSKDIKREKRKLQDRLSSLIEREKQKEKNKEFGEDFGALPLPSIEPLDNFDEPIFRRIRSRRGFF